MKQSAHNKSRLDIDYESFTSQSISLKRVFFAVLQRISDNIKEKAIEGIRRKLRNASS